MDEQEIGLENLEKRLQLLEFRIACLESSIASEGGERTIDPGKELYNSEKSSVAETPVEEGKELESRIGRIGLAWLGNIVLSFAVIFFTEYLVTIDHRLFSLLFGAGSVAVIFWISYYLKRSNQNLALMFNVNGQIILFYEALKLYFFTSRPLLPDKTLVLIILIIIIALQVYLALRHNSRVYGFLSVCFALCTAIMSDTPHILLPMLTLTATGVLYYFYRNTWSGLLGATIFFIYIIFFLWLFGNPFMGHPMEILPVHNYGHLYLFAIGGSFSMLPLFRKKDGTTDDLIIGAIILNGILFTLILSFFSIKYFSHSYVGLFTIITVCSLIYSVILKYVSEWKFPSAFYALYGFLAMSISLYGMVGLPGVYLLLSVQSLVVVSMALWFSNRLIIVMNSMLFIIILLVYQFFAKSVNTVNFSFAIVPLLSARIINWKKARLNIRTDFIRNLYLIEGFFMVLYALYHALPGQFVTLSWTMAALTYFLLSFILRNIKYRYMALGTMILAAIYLFIVDLAKIGIIYRIIALLFLAVVSIGISIYYTNRIKQKSQ